MNGRAIVSRVALIVLALGLVLGAEGTAAARRGKPKPRPQPPATRTASAFYVCNAYNPCDLSTAPFGGGGLGGGEYLWTLEGEHFVKIEVDDEESSGVAFSVFQIYEGQDRFIGRGCGSGGPFPIEEGVSIRIFLATGTCGSPEPGIGTDGNASGDYFGLSTPTRGHIWATFAAKRSSFA